MLSPLENAQLRRMVSTANKRIKALQEKGYDNLAADLLLSATGNAEKFTLRGLSETQREQTFRAVKRFLGYKTSTIKGYKAHLENKERGALESARAKGLENETAYKDILKGLPSFSALADSYNMASDEIQQALIYAANNGVDLDTSAAVVKNDLLDYEDIDDYDF